MRTHGKSWVFSDPHMVAQLGVAFASGLQGGAVGGPDTYGNFSSMLTEAKHFGAYGQSRHFLSFTRLPLY